MTTYSFYIPRVCRTYNEDQIKIVFSDVLMIGDVKRVDFVPISKRFQRAFVHMDFFYNIETTNEIRNIVFEQGKAAWVYPSQLFTPLRIENAQSASSSSLITAPEGGVLNERRCKNPLLEKVEQKVGPLGRGQTPYVEQNFCSLFPKKRLIDKRMFWILLKNKNPIPETIMNISQISYQMNTIIHYLKTLNDKIEPDNKNKPETERPLGSLLDKMFNNPFSFIHFIHF